MHLFVIVFVLLWSIFCIMLGDWLLRKGVAFQNQGIAKRGVWLQILGAIVTLGLPILVACMMS
jgi:hypothetical protein